ncbi:hypothetical protein ABIG06_001617 [Bradyrhizobium sp. USDA 326]|uniref:hypothetical protein n=1 Tax=Bradyrhizobium sp. USDA 326 TaxID=3377726 RepID=UPI003C74D002
MITWKVRPDGAIKIASTYAKPMELSWRAFALSLIAGEVADGEKNVNLRFLHDPTNFNVVTTAQGKLGNLLGHGRCTIVEPVSGDYLPKVDENQATTGDLWRVLLLVNCNIPGPRYFTREGGHHLRETRWTRVGAAILPCQAYCDISPGLLV